MSGDARSEYDRHHPWRCWLGGLHAGRARTRQAAMNLVDRPFRRGAAIVRNERSGEEWIRRRGWFQNAPATNRAPREAAAELKAAAASGGEGTSTGPALAAGHFKQGVLL